MTEIKSIEVHGDGGMSFSGSQGVNTYKAYLLVSAMGLEVNSGIKSDGDAWRCAQRAFDGVVQFDEIGRCTNKREVLEHCQALGYDTLIRLINEGDERSAKRAKNAEPPKERRGTGDTDTVVQSIGGVFDITKEQVIELISCAIEVPGCMQTFLVHESREPTNENDIPSLYKEQRYLSHCWGDGQVILVNKDELYENDEDPRECELLTLNEEGIKRGLNVFAKYCKSDFKDFITDDADADTGLEFLQCCLFPEYVERHGHTVYG